MLTPLTKTEILAQSIQFSKNKKNARNIVTLNTLMLLEGWKDENFLNTLKEADLIISDSIGISLAATLFFKGFKKFCRYPGIELMQTLIKKGNRSFFLGGKPEVARKAGQNLKKKLKNTVICGYHHGYFSDDENKKIIKKINRANPEILFVGLNMKKQELWINNNKHLISTGLIMGIGGSFDVISGNLKRAPSLLRRTGLEWCWRLLMEPWRFPRIIKLPVFVLKVIHRKFSGKEFF